MCQVLRIEISMLFLTVFLCASEEIPDKRMYTSAFTISFGYLLGGLIPLLLQLFIQQAFAALIYSRVVTGTVLLIISVVKARVTGAATAEGGIRSYVWGALSTLIISHVPKNRLLPLLPPSFTISSKCLFAPRSWLSGKSRHILIGLL